LASLFALDARERVLCDISVFLLTSPPQGFLQLSLTCTVEVNF
jgi:hypothetical protein